LVGLKDDYVHDGRVLVENLDHHVLPPAIKNSLRSYVALAQAYKDINATKGPLGVASLVYANQSITSDDTAYANYLTTIGAITAERDQLASQMIALLNAAAFDGQPIGFVDDLVDQAGKLVAKVEGLAQQGR
jgi:hypothetical protein